VKEFAMPYTQAVYTAQAALYKQALQWYWLQQQRFKGGQSDLLNNLVVYWKMDETSGTRFDSTANSINLTAINTVGSGTGIINNAAKLIRPNNELLRHPNDTVLQMGDIDFTIAFWFKATSLPDHMGLVSKYDSSAEEYLVDWLDSTEVLRFVVWDGSSFGVTTLSFPATQTGDWYFVVAWHDATNDTINLQLFDGATNPTSTTAHSTGVAVDTAVFEVGRFLSNNTYCFNGLIDEVGIWKRVLTSAERVELYDNGLGLSYPFDTLPTSSTLLNDLNAYWNLDETSGTRFDKTSNSNDLTDNNTVGSATGKISNAGDFVAANSEYLSVANNASLQTGDIDFTIAFWVYFDSLTANIIASKRDGSGSEYQIYMGGSSPYRIKFAVFNPSLSVVEDTSLGTPSLSTWYFIVCWYDSAANTLNIQSNNGTVVTATGISPPSTTTARFNIGEAVGFYMNGRIDEFGFWKRILTSSERTELYNSGSGLTYPFV
jgi:hypothetical protein